MRAMASICFAGLLTLLESGCGGGTHTAPPPAALSISTTSLADGMVSFPYSQTILATGGVAPFVWSVPSGSLPHNVTLASSSVSSVALSGSPDTAQTATFTIQVEDSKNQNAAQAYTTNIAPTGFVQLQAVPGQVPAGVVEIQGVAAGPFNPNYWQGNTLNWVPDVRIPMFAALTTGLWQNIYPPWALEQSTGWRMFYGGWDGTATSNDRIYSVSTPDFLSFNNRTLVIDHGDFLHVNNANVTQLPRWLDAYDLLTSNQRAHPLNGLHGVIYRLPSLKLIFPECLTIGGVLIRVNRRCLDHLALPPTLPMQS
jgi:hypothetical protein